MQMTFRWFGDKLDTVSLNQIKQIPGVVGVVPALHDLPAGEAWTMDRVQAMYDEITAAGLSMECIESVNVHEDIKIGLPTRDKYIENYKTSIRNLSKVGVKVICYNFMPVFDWTRTDLYMPLPDGSTCLCYDGKQVEGKSPEDMFKEIDDNSNGYAMPGWEPERMGEIKELFENTRASLPMTFGQTSNISLTPLCRLVRNVMLKWQSTRMIRPGASSACRASLPARRLLKSCSQWFRANTTALLSAPAHSAQALKTIWLKLSKRLRAEFILPTCAMFSTMTNGLTKQLTKVRQARLICMKL